MKKLISLLTGKIRVKIFSVIIAVIIFFLLIVHLTSYSILFRTFTRDTYRELCSVADAVNYLAPLSGSYYFDLYSLAENHNVDFELVDVDGTLHYTSTGNASALSSEHFTSSGSASSEYSSMLPSTRYKNNFRYRNFEIKKKSATNADYFVYHDEVTNGDTIYVYSSVADVENIVATAEKVYSIFSISVFFLLGVVLLIFTSRFTKPIEEINNVTKDMAALDFERKCDDYGRDEIGELGRSINTLSNTLDSTLMDLKDKNEQLQKDIELKQALDNARKSFISNVSHELKTPIAIISGYAEGLYEGISDDPQVIREYCKIINDESKKMNNLVLELLELSKLESKSQPFIPSYFDLGKAVYDITDHLSLQFENNGIEVTNNIPLSLECFAQDDKIEIVLKNYITNAISHCSGAKKIVLDYADKGRTYSVSVFNTGDRISEEDMPELWESFYRADKSHRRSESRFGLGLSIVRNIMENHQCEYGVENTPDGVVFSFEVPKDKTYYDTKENR